MHTVIDHGGIVPALTNASEEAQMVVVGSRGLGTFRRLALGSVSSGLLHHAHCPIAVIRGGQTKADEFDAPVLLGIDGSPASEAATAVAFDEASRRGVELVALHAWSDFGSYLILDADWHEYEALSEEFVTQRLTGWRESFPDVPVHRRIFSNKPAYWLTEESRQAQLVVVGSHGRGGLLQDLFINRAASSLVGRGSPEPDVVR